MSNPSNVQEHLTTAEWRDVVLLLIGLVLHFIVS